VTRKQRIEQSLSEAFRPGHLLVIDESHQHSVPKGAESHFNVTVVTELFGGESRVARHRRIHDLLAGELAAGLHALTLTLLTPDEFEARGGESLASPKCMGGSKAG
jgi:BolA protein